MIIDHNRWVSEKVEIAKNIYKYMFLLRKGAPQDLNTIYIMVIQDSNNIDKNYSALQVAEALLKDNKKLIFPSDIAQLNCLIDYLRPMEFQDKYDAAIYKIFNLKAELKEAEREAELIIPKCPSCQSNNVYRVCNRNYTFECQNCGANFAV
jgi:hypothetical protein